MPALTPGMRLGAFEIEALIGAGGMGEVYRARDTRLGRTVALKVLPAPVTGIRSGGSDSSARRAPSRRSPTPVSVQLHDIGHQDGIDFLVMGSVQGETLSARLAAGAIPVAQALRTPSKSPTRSTRRIPTALSIAISSRATSC